MKFTLDIQNDTVSIELQEPPILTEEQQYHAGHMLYLLSNGGFNEELKGCLKNTNLDLIDESWDNHELMLKEKIFLNEDIISPHQMMGESLPFQTWSMPITSIPKSIQPTFREIDTSKQPKDPEKEDYSTEFFEENNLIGYETMYEMNTNFRMTKELSYMLLGVEALAILHPLGRHKCLIAFGDRFNADEAQQEIYEVIDSYFQSLNLTV